MYNPKYNRLPHAQPRSSSASAFVNSAGAPMKKAKDLQERPFPKMWPRFPRMIAGQTLYTGPVARLKRFSEGTAIIIIIIIIRRARGIGSSQGIDRYLLRSNADDCFDWLRRQRNCDASTTERVRDGQGRYEKKTEMLKFVSTWNLDAAKPANRAFSY